jgi:Flp pilus assembly protein TadG
MPKERFATLPDLPRSTRMVKHHRTQCPGGVLGQQTFRLLRSDAGSVSLEFIFLLPFLIMVLVGMIDGSLILYDKAALMNAARAGARAGTVLKVPPLTTSQIASITTTSAQSSLLSFGNATSPVVTVTQTNGTVSGSSLQVEVSYTYTGLLLGSVLSALNGPLVLEATAVMAYE